MELKTLHAMLIADRIVLLYSPSGAGKTSLLRGIEAIARRRRLRRGADNPGDTRGAAIAG